MCLNSLLQSCNISSVVSCPTRIQNNSISATDNIFIDSTKLEMYIVTPLLSGLSEHKVQLLEILYIDLEVQKQQPQLMRKIDNHSMADFIMKLSYETWDTLFSNVDIDTKFNSFLNYLLKDILLKIFFKKAKNNTWKASKCSVVSLKVSRKQLVILSSLKQH
jgi:hypothetical protein